MKTRLDAELVRRELARSREHAADLIESRSVLVAGIPATKPATQVDADTDSQKSAATQFSKVSVLVHFLRPSPFSKVTKELAFEKGCPAQRQRLYTGFRFRFFFFTCAAATSLHRQYFSSLK